MDGWTDGRTDGWMEGRTDGRMDEWMDGRMDGWMVEEIKSHETSASPRKYTSGNTQSAA